MTTLLYLAFPLVCILAVPSSTRHGGLAERFVTGVALYQLLLLASGVLLGTLGLLKSGTFTAVLLAASVILAPAAWHNRVHPNFSAPMTLWNTRRGKAALLLAALCLLTLSSEVIFDFIRGTRHSDGLWYHIPRVLTWLSQGDFTPWPTPVAAAVGLPVGADLLLLHGMLLGLGWKGAGWVTFLLTVGAAAAVYLIAVEHHLPRWQAAMAALLFASFPAIGLRVWSINSDIAAAFPALAAYLLLRRVDDTRIALTLFLLLNGVAAACKPTVILPALLLGAAGLWQQRQRLARLRSPALPTAAVLAAAALVMLSYLPVYRAFGDFLGGDYSRAHRATGLADFARSVAMHTLHWVLEPLGYLGRFSETAWNEPLRMLYNVFGGAFDVLPEDWKPYPGQDTACTGLAPALALPLLFAGLAPRRRLAALALFACAYLPLSGMILPQPYAARYNLILLAGVAMLWATARCFRRGRGRWFLAGLVALNLSALLGVVAINIYLAETSWSLRDEDHYLSDGDRLAIAVSLAGRPLLVMAESSAETSSMDALLVGPQPAFPLAYVMCPPGGDWPAMLEQAARRSPWLALVHHGRPTLNPGPQFPRPGEDTCPGLSVRQVEEALEQAGWRLFRNNPVVDLWRHEVPPR